MFRLHRFLLACLLIVGVANPVHAGDAGRILIVVSGEGRDQGKTRPGYEFDELSQAWLIFKANGFAVDVASPQGGAVEADKYNAQEPFNAALLADADAMLERGVYLAPSAFEAGFMSSAHTPDVIEATLAAAREAFKVVAAG